MHRHMRRKTGGSKDFTWFLRLASCKVASSASYFAVSVRVLFTTVLHSAAAVRYELWQFSAADAGSGFSGCIEM